MDLEQSAIALTPEGREKLAASLASLPPAGRSNYGIPEADGFRAGGSPHPAGGMQALGETTQSPDDVILQTVWQHADDTIVHHRNVELQRASTGWRMVGPTILADRAVADITRNGYTGTTSSEEK